MKEETRNNIRGEIARRQMSQSVFAELSGIHPKAFNRKINGHADFTWDEVENMIDALQIRDNLSELHRIFF